METKHFGLIEQMIDIHSDPTYEAWKPGSLKDQSGNGHDTPILPTRHGNLYYSLLAYFITPLRSYLRGMET